MTDCVHEVATGYCKFKEWISETDCGSCKRYESMFEGFRKDRDSILCSDKEEAKGVIDAIGAEFIDEFEYLEGGEVKIYLNKPLNEIAPMEE